MRALTKLALRLRLLLDVTESDRHPAWSCVARAGVARGMQHGAQRTACRDTPPAEEPTFLTELPP
jgi:hypothetical protein